MRPRCGPRRRRRGRCRRRRWPANALGCWAHPPCRSSRHGARRAPLGRKAGGASAGSERSGSSEGREAGVAASADAWRCAPAVEEAGRPSAAHRSGTARIAGAAERSACCAPGALVDGKTGAVRKEEPDEGALWLDVDAPADAEAPVTLYCTGASLMSMQNERLASSWWRTASALSARREGSSGSHMHAHVHREHPWFSAPKGVGRRTNRKVRLMAIHTMRASGPRSAAAAGAELAESPSAALPDSRSGWSSQLPA